MMRPIPYTAISTEPMEKRAKIASQKFQHLQKSEASQENEQSSQRHHTSPRSPVQSLPEEGAQFILFRRLRDEVIAPLAPHDEVLGGNVRTRGRAGTLNEGAQDEERIVRLK